MTYQDDRDKHIVYEPDNGMSWLLGGLVVVALVAGLIFFFSPDATTNTASNMERAPVTTPTTSPAQPRAPETTGSGAVTPPAPSPSPNR